jgi:peroxiredoxin
MPEEPLKVPVGSEASDFALEGGAGVVRLGDYRGRAAVLLVFMRAFG